MFHLIYLFHLLLLNYLNTAHHQELNQPNDALTDLRTGKKPEREPAPNDEIKTLSLRNTHHIRLDLNRRLRKTERRLRIRMGRIEVRHIRAQELR
jgi:hypothetical protein